MSHQSLCYVLGMILQTKVSLLCSCNMIDAVLKPPDMFRSLRQSELAKDHVFAVTVGASSKQTLASWHLLEPSDVISCISLLNGSADAGNVGAIAVVDGGPVPEARI